MPRARLASSSTTRIRGGPPASGMRDLFRGFRGLRLDHTREVDGEGGAPALAFALRAHRAAVGLHHGLDDEQAEARSRPRAAHLGPDAIETVEDEPKVGPVHSHPAILDGEAREAVVLLD